MRLSSSADECPPPESWLRLLGDEVTEADRQVFEGHLDTCESCRQTLDSLAGPLDLGPKREARPDLSPILDPIAGREFEHDEVETPPEIPGLSAFEEVGRGGMGIVYRALQDGLNRAVAVKVLSRFGPSTRERVAREARAMAALKHANAVAVHWTGRFEGIPYLVMEWVEGGTLQQWVDRGPLEFREAARIVADLAGAVSQAHALGIVHRDLKPSNVLIEPGPPRVPKLVDFGLALDADGSRLTGNGLILGTPSSMAPEQTGLVAGLGPVGPSADIHGLGAILFALLTGRPPYRGESVWETLGRAARGDAHPLKTLRPDVPPGLEAIVSRCLRVKPAERYASAADLSADLECFLDGTPLRTRLPGPAARLGRWLRRGPARAGVALVLLGSGLSAAILSAWQSQDSPAAPARSADDVYRELGTLTERVNTFQPDFEHPLVPEDRAFLVLVTDRFRGAKPGPNPWMARTFARSTVGAADKLFTLAKQLHLHKSFSDARLALETARSIHRHGVRLDPDSDEREGKLLEVEEALFWLLHNKKLDEPAEALAREMMASLHGQSDLSFVRGYKLLLAKRYLTLLLPLRGAFREAEQVHAELVPILARLRSQRKDDRGIVFHQLDAFWYRVKNLEQLGRLEDTLEVLQDYEEVARSLGEDALDGDNERAALSGPFEKRAEVSRKLGQERDAQEYALRWAGVARRAAQKYPDKEPLLDDSTRSALALVDAFPATGRPAEVAEAIRTATDLETLWARARPPRSNRKASFDSLIAAQQTR